MKNPFSKKLALTVLVAAVYGWLNYVTYGFSLPGSAAVISVRPQVILPMLGGFLMGPCHGFFIGFAGNLLGDWLCDLGFRFWAFSVGNGMMGAFPGFLYLAGIRRIETVAQFTLMLLAITFGNILGMGMGVLGHNFFYGDTFELLTWGFFQPMIVSNVLLGFMLIPPFLFAFRRMTGTFDIRLSIALFYLLILIILLLIYALNLTAHRILSLKLNGILASQALTEFLAAIALNDFRLGGTIGIAMIIGGISMTLLLLHYLLRPVRTLTLAAQLLKAGRIDQIDLTGMKNKSDEFGKLAQVFDDAVIQVKEREESLKQVIEKLQVEINRDQEARQVREITETDYFRSLQERSRTLRSRREPV